MRKVVFLLSALFALSSFITEDPKVKQIPLNAPSTNGHNFSQWDIPADMPDVYYNSELGVITINEKSCTITDVDPNSNIMINHRQNIPFIAPLILQNETIENDQYIIATSLTAGNHVDANRTSGDFIIPSAKQFEVEYSDKVVLAPGFKVNKGGIFKARLGASTYKNR